MLKLSSAYIHKTMTDGRASTGLAPVNMWSVFSDPRGGGGCGRPCALPVMVMYSYLDTAAWLQTTNFNVEMRFWTQYSSKYLGVKFGKLSKSAKCKKNRFDKGSKAMFGLMLSGWKIWQHKPDVIFWWKCWGNDSDTSVSFSSKLSMWSLYGSTLTVGPVGDTGLMRVWFSLYKTGIWIIWLQPRNYART